MQPLPVPCPADLTLDATTVDALNAAYKQAEQQHAVFIAVEQQGRRWTVKADALTAGPHHSADDSAYDAIRSAVIHLIVDSEPRARELAAALHAALYGDLEALARALRCR